MSGRYRLTPRALADLDAIADYTLAHWGEAQMATYLRSLADRFTWLARNPQLGRLRPEIASDVRCYRECSHLIFYRSREDAIEIIGIPHQAMDVDGYFQT